MTIGSEDAAFLVGTGGATKAKVARAAGVRLDLNDEQGGSHTLEITGSQQARDRAKQYVEWVLRQRVGQIAVDMSTRREDLSIVEVPEECVAYVMGKNGSVLRSIEEEWGTLMFFGRPTNLPGGDDDTVMAARDDDSGRVKKRDEKLMICGSRRARRGSELKVMSAVEHKMAGYFVDGAEKKLKNRLDQVGDGEGDGFGYDVFPFEGEEFSYALGAQVRAGGFGKNKNKKGGRGGVSVVGGVLTV